MGNILNEREVRNGRLVAYEPFLLGKDAIEDTKNTLDLLLVTLNRAGDLLGVEL